MQVAKRFTPFEPTRDLRSVVISGVWGGAPVVNDLVAFQTLLYTI